MPNVPPAGVELATEHGERFNPVAFEPRPGAGDGGNETTQPISFIDEAGNFVKLTPAQLAMLSPSDRALYDQILKLQPGAGGGSKAEDPDITRGRQAYVDIWGIDPPKGYINSLVGQGMNPYEIRAHELSKLGPDGKPLAKTSSYWRDQQATYASVASQVFARR